MARRKTLDTWIHEALTDTDKDTQITNITLFHMRGQQPVELHTWKPGGSHGAEPKKLAELFYDKAHTYSQDLDGTQMFNLCAFYGKSVPEAQMPFAVRVEADVHATGLATEAPTETGMRQQSMRWSEMQLGQVYRRQQIMDDHSIRMIEQQSQMIGSLMTERFGMAQMVVDMMAQHGANQHKLAMEQMEYQRSTQERQKLMQLAPALVNSLTGKEVFPQATSDTALVESIANSLDESHLSKLMEMGLPDALLGPLADRIMRARQKKMEEEQAKAALPSYKGKPEDDIKGGAE